MKAKKSLTFSEFINELCKYQFILLGEIHGTKEIPALVKKIISSLCNYNIMNIFFEIPANYQNYLEKYRISKKKDDLYKIPFFKKNRDGRGSKEYLSLISYVVKLKRNIGLYFVDPSSNKIKKRDYDIYQNIKKVLNKKDQDNINLFIGGNVHTCTKPFKLNNKKINTAGYYLKKLFKRKLVSVNLLPLKGKYYNCGIKIIHEKRPLKKTIFRNEGGGYDFICYLKKVSPCSFI